jgi:hypothetical protein
MKIILEGLKMRSEVMDWPEKTEPFIKIVLRQPIIAITGYSGDKIGEIPPLHTLAEFEWTGKSYTLPDGEFARIYMLRDIYKR